MRAWSRALAVVRRGDRSPVGAIGVLVGYVILSLGYFGWRLWPHPGRFLVGTSGTEDPQKYVWWFEWWPHAILNWENPFYSHAVFAPTGIDLVWTTSVPALALVFSPLTLLFGPVVSYNVAAVLLPALSAWTAYLLLRYIQLSIASSLVGGYLYGFSSYVLAHQLAGHLNLTGIFLTPLVARAVLRHTRGEMTDRRLIASIGCLVAFQFYISTEVGITLTMMLWLALVLAFFVTRELRPKLIGLVFPLLAGFACAGVLAGPLIYYGVVVGSPPALIDPSAFSADLLNLVVPTPVTGWGGQSFIKLTQNFPGGINERDSYVGLPALLIVMLLLLRHRSRRSPGIRFLAWGFVVATLLSFGAALHFNGHRLFWLPWSLLTQVPIFNNITPSRLALYATLPLAMLVALWIDNTRGRVFRRPYVLPTLAVAALVPSLSTSAWDQHPERLAFFSDGFYKQCIARGETLLIFPFGNMGASMLWQAESQFWFNMTEGDLGHYPANYLADPTIIRFVNYSGFQHTPMNALIDLERRRPYDRVVSAVALSALNPGETTRMGVVYPSREQLRAFGRPQRVADVLVSPGCTQAALAGDAAHHGGHGP